MLNSVWHLQGPHGWTLQAFASLLQALVPALLMNICIVGLNQIFDVPIDRINKPYLPLASGEFTMRMGQSIVCLSAKREPLSTSIPPCSAKLAVIHVCLGIGMDSCYWPSLDCGAAWVLCVTNILPLCGNRATQAFLSVHHRCDSIGVSTCRICVRGNDVCYMLIAISGGRKTHINRSSCDGCVAPQVAATGALALALGTLTGSGPLLATLVGSLVLGIVYSTDLPFLGWKQHTILAAGCILSGR